MKHFKLDIDSVIKSGDLVLYRDRWQEIYTINEDSGLLLSNSGWTCRTKIEEEFENK